MAKVHDVDEVALAAWLAGRPAVIQEMVRTHPPGRLYRMKSTGQRVTLLSYSEDRTCRVDISGEYNVLCFERKVFGVEIADLEECDLPAHGEVVGSLDMDPHDPVIMAAIKRPRA